MNDLQHKLVELGFIYCLKNPKTDEIFYIGATESAPKDRLAGHYGHFKEYLNGKRSLTQKFKYFEDIWPEFAKIELLEIIQNDFLYQKEIEYIEKYSKICNLTNQTIGGEGGDTFTLQESFNKEKISQLISIKNSKPKPAGFSEHLSEIRKGAGNPMAAMSTMPKCIVFDGEDNPIQLITAPYQIAEFFDNIFGYHHHKTHAGRAGNISKAIKAKGFINSTGYLFKDFNQCSIEIQDIVQQTTKVV